LYYPNIAQTPTDPVCRAISGKLHYISLDNFIYHKHVNSSKHSQKLEKVLSSLYKGRFLSSQFCVKVQLPNCMTNFCTWLLLLFEYKNSWLCFTLITMLREQQICPEN